MSVQGIAWRVVLALAIAGAGVGAADAAAKRARRAPHAPAATAACPREGTLGTLVARVTDGDTFFTGDGHEVDLAGVMAPGSGGERTTAPQMQAARDVLQNELTSGPVMLAVMGPPDRYGRLKAQVFTGGAWVQAKLLSDGTVRAAPDLVSAPCTPAFLAIEKRARDANAGHWGDGLFRVATPDDLRHATGTFQIVDGEVQTAAVVKSRVYLNFGADWKRDFTATIAPEDKRAFMRPRVDWKALAGKHVRVRGWIEFYNGPMISLHAPGEIEFIDALPKPERKPRKPRKPRAPKPPASGE